MEEISLFYKMTLVFQLEANFLMLSNIVKNKETEVVLDLGF